MALTRETAARIVDVVRSDPHCRKHIDSVFALIPDEWGAAGAIRNFAMVLADSPNYAIEMGVNKWQNFAHDLRFRAGAVPRPSPQKYRKPKLFPNNEAWVDNYICTGIAEATVAVINRALAGKPGIADVEKAQGLSRNTGIAHHGTQIVMKDGSDYVFDWHATLNIDNPMIFRTHHWHACGDGIPFDRFRAYGAPPKAG